ncbi:MAG TPA: MarR family transcriptional regulator [Sneathiellales bacterium]|nr:MarR family transcriptional regulator [Sneathiellales bacterium]
MAEPRNISDLVDRIGRIVHAIQFASGLNPAQWEALRFLSRANSYSRSPGALAEYLGSTKGTVSQTIIALESKGYVVRNRSETDRRSINIELTDEGHDLVSQDPLCLVEGAVSGLAPADRDNFARSMDSLIKNLQRERGQAEFGVCGECVHNRSDGEFGENCHCILRDEVLLFDELAQICLDFQSAQHSS